VPSWKNYITVVRWLYRGSRIQDEIVLLTCGILATATVRRRLNEISP